MTIANMIQMAMEQKGWNAYDLERASGVPQPTIHRILSGKHNEPRRSTVQKLARGLGLTESQLLGISENTLPVASPPPAQLPATVEAEAANADPLGSLTPRQRAMVQLFDALPKSEQEEVLANLQAKKQQFDQWYEELSAQRAAQGR